MTGTELIAAERERQIRVEGFTPDHDAKHKRSELTAGAECYARYARQQLNHQVGELHHPKVWPFAIRWWKPSHDPIRNLTKAGAMIAAEIDRLLAHDHQPADPSGDTSHHHG